MGRGYRAPSLFERFGAGFDPVYGYSVYGDPRLTPEHSISVDAGFDQSLWQNRVKISAATSIPGCRMLLVSIPPARSIRLPILSAVMWAI